METDHVPSFAVQPMVTQENRGLSSPSERPNAKADIVGRTIVHEAQEKKPPSKALSTHRVSVLSLVGRAMCSTIRDVCIRIAHLCQKLASRIFHFKLYADRYRFLLSTHTMRESEFQWHLNLALLRQAEKSTSDEKQLRQIRFLQVQYLSKVAPIYMKYMRLLDSRMESRFQVTPLPGAHYHRSGFRHEQGGGVDRLNKNLALEDASPLILTDTSDFTHLLPLKFRVVEDSSIVTTIVDHISAHLDSQGEATGLQKPLALGFLFDAPEELQRLMHIGADKRGNETFQRAYSAYQKRIHEQMDQAVQVLAKKYPSLSSAQLRAYMYKNSTSICRVDFENMSGIKVLPLFTSLKGSRLEEAHPALLDFIEQTGLYINAITMRRYLYDEQLQEVDTEMARPADQPAQQVARYYPLKDSFIRTNLFRMLTQKFESQDLAASPHISVLGRATLNLLQGLLEKISDEKWEEMNQNPATCQILQNTLFKIFHHLATAHQHINSYDAFAQDIELVHYEMGTLLELTSPFQAQDFPEIYKRALHLSIPENLRGMVRAGLGKTAVNTFAGINAALMKTTPHPVRAYSTGFYFEQASLVREENCFETLLHDPSVPTVDLYCGQFNPNVEIASDHTHYAQRDIAADLTELLEKKPAIKHLTVAIDCTTDYIGSTKVRDLLARFSDKIADGTLNFVFFKSGQKMDMFGMDNYFGAPFYIVNNGSAHWQEFAALSEQRAHQTDALSAQWFCLANAYAAESMDAYRKIIFQNSRSILARIPESLKPNPHNPTQSIRVSTVDEKMEPSFIDIKVLGAAHKLRSVSLLGLLYQKCEDRGIKIHSKASFGFYHLNGIVIQVNEVGGSSTIRINPSLNPEENDVLLELLNEIASQA